MLANKKTYEILTPEAVGITTNNIVLGKHSGRHAFESRLKELGYALEQEEMNRCFEEFKLLCDKKKDVEDEDIIAIVTHSATADDEADDAYKLDWFAVQTSNITSATCTVCLKHGDEKVERVCLGDGPVDAAISAIEQIIKPVEHTFELYQINSVSRGQDTLGDVHVKLNASGRTFTGHGLSTDIIEASILAYLRACSKLSSWTEKQAAMAM